MVISDSALFAMYPKLACFARTGQGVWEAELPALVFDIPLFTKAGGTIEDTIVSEIAKYRAQVSKLCSGEIWFAVSHEVTTRTRPAANVTSPLIKTDSEVAQVVTVTALFEFASDAVSVKLSHPSSEPYYL